MQFRSRHLTAAVLALSVAGCTAAPADTSRISVSSDPSTVSDESGGSSQSSDYAPVGVPLLPYENQRLLDLDDPNRPVDDVGVHMYMRDDERFLHPVATAQYALAALDGWQRQSDEEYLRRALANADALVDQADTHAGGLFFPYPFDFPLGDESDNVIHAPWYSAMAQGLAMSLFVRLWEETLDDRWRQAAHDTFASFAVPRSSDEPWVVMTDERSYLWLVEYAGDTPPLKVLNGHVFGIYGLYDYYRMTGSHEAEHLFDAAATTVRAHINDFRVPGDVSYYCAREDFCQRELWQNEKYHVIHTHQLAMLAQMTGDKSFQAASDEFAQDYSPD